jgi:hypothetical protein
VAEVNGSCVAESNHGVGVEALADGQSCRQMPVRRGVGDQRWFVAGLHPGGEPCVLREVPLELRLLRLVVDGSPRRTRPSGEELLHLAVEVMPCPAFGLWVWQASPVMNTCGAPGSASSVEASSNVSVRR